MRARLLVLVGAQQEIGEVDMAHRIIGMVGDRFRIDPAGGIDGAHTGQQRSEFVERAEMRRRPAQDIDEGLLGFLPPVERAEQHRALDFGIDGVAVAAPMHQQLVELPQPRFLRQPGRPAAAPGVTGRSHVLSWGGHDAKG
jgi:hypothetical protein